MNGSPTRNLEVGRRNRGATDSPPGRLHWQREFWLPITLTILFGAFALLPPARTNSSLVWTFCAVGVALLAWQSILLFRAAHQGRRLEVQFVPVKSHYVQAMVQFSVYAYWGLSWPKIYEEAPLIISQIVFLYLFDLLLSWSRRARWVLGFGPFPIIFSTNLFMWFRDDWFIFQFLMVATGALGKEFIKWQREGKRTHIFNPSALGLSLFSIVLLATNSTDHTWAEELATLLREPPYIYLHIFLIGLVVQYFFSVTLMTLAAAAMLCVLNLIYTSVAGVYHFIDSNIPIAVFLGLHLLMTDPATSPKTNAGRVIFGAGYGLSVFLLYALLAHFGVPRFYDKLLAVPLLNLSVPLIDRLCRSGILGRFTRWEAGFRPQTLNLVHMGCWGAVFVSMFATGFVGSRHEGVSLAFWQRASEEGRWFASRNVLAILNNQAKAGSAEAFNELGLIHMEGKLVKRDPGVATHLFAEACELGNSAGCANAAIQFLFHGTAKSLDEAAEVLDYLENVAAHGTNAVACYLMGFAFDSGRGRPVDRSKAVELYAKGCDLGSLDACKALARMRLSGETVATADQVVRALEKACGASDAEACLYLALVFHNGDGVPQ